MKGPIDDAPAGRLSGVLLGTALGDALGLACEGMSAEAIARRFGVVDRFRMLGRTGFVSDDTEQSALIAQSLAKFPDDVDACVRSFQRSLLGWFCRLPWGVGMATIRSCLRMGLGLSPSGVMSAGNGAAMRAAVIGVFFQDRPNERSTFGRALAEVTHRDPRAVEGALFVAEAASCCAGSSPGAHRTALLVQARSVVDDLELGMAIDRGLSLAEKGADTHDAAQVCGTSGFVVHTVAFAAYCFASHGAEPMRALTEAIGAGGDADSIAAILGAWLGALHGESNLPESLIDRIHDGAFGPTHLRSLAACLAERREGRSSRVPRYFAGGGPGPQPGVVSRRPGTRISSTRAVLTGRAIGQEGGRGQAHILDHALGPCQPRRIASQLAPAHNLRGFRHAPNPRPEPSSWN